MVCRVGCSNHRLRLFGWRLSVCRKNAIVGWRQSYWNSFHRPGPRPPAMQDLFWPPWAEELAEGRRPLADSIIIIDFNGYEPLLNSELPPTMEFHNVDDSLWLSVRCWWDMASSVCLYAAKQGIQIARKFRSTKAFPNLGYSPIISPTSRRKLG